MLDYVKITSADVELGTPLQKAIYDKNGVLLIKAGGIIDSERHLHFLLEKDVYCRADDDSAWLSVEADAQIDPGNVFELLDATKTKLKRLFDVFRMGNAREEFPARIEEIAIGLQKACLVDIDAVLANLHLDYDTPYAVIHSVQTAILCEAVGKRLGVKEVARLMLMNAALTHDIDLIDIQHLLDRNTLPLSDQHLERIRNHPKAGAKTLRELGVQDATWLNAVEHHHERLDGSGYGDALSGDAIKIPARILAIADIYSAMTQDRPSHKAVAAKDALRSMLLAHDGKNDERLIQILIKEIGVFPPGVIVQLANKEIAVVKERRENGACPIVYSFIDPLGNTVPAPERRETVVPEYKIQSILPLLNYRGSIAILRDVWTSGPT